MKKKIGELYNKPIIEGDKNLVTKNEIHIDELSGGNSQGDSLGDDMLFFRVDMMDNADSTVNGFIAMMNSGFAINNTSYSYDPYSGVMVRPIDGQIPPSEMSYIGINNRIKQTGVIQIGSSSIIPTNYIQEEIDLFEFMQTALLIAQTDEWAYRMWNNTLNDLKKSQVSKSEVENFITQGNKDFIYIDIYHDQVKIPFSFKRGTWRDNIETNSTPSVQYFNIEDDHIEFNGASLINNEELVSADSLIIEKGVYTLRTEE